MDELKVSRKKTIKQIIQGSIYFLLLIIFSIFDIDNPIGFFKRGDGEEVKNIVNFKVVLIIMSILVILFLISLIKALISLKKNNLEYYNKSENFLNTMSVVPLILMCFIFFDAFFFSPVSVSGLSMQKTFNDRDVVLVSHFKNNLRIDDVVIIRTETDLIIKRVVAKEGDTITTSTGVGPLFVNGVKVVNNQYFYKHYINYTLKKGEYYCLGDNRVNSKDSKYWGIFTDDDIIGKVSFKLMPLDFKMEKDIING